MPQRNRTLGDDVLGQLMQVEGGEGGASEAEQMAAFRDAIRKAAPNLDAKAFMADVMEAMSKLEGTKGFSSPTDALQGELKNVVVEGDRATGTLQGEDGKDLHFVRVDGRWYLTALGMLGN
jgi:hypothetical protein